MYMYICCIYFKTLHIFIKIQLEVICIKHSPDSTTITDLVESLKVLNGRGDNIVVWELVFQVSNKHSKLCSPVSYMVDSQDIMADPFQQTTDTLTDDGRPDCTHITHTHKNESNHFIIVNEPI